MAICLFGGWLQGGNLANFPFLDEKIVDGGASLQGNVQLKIITHMESLSTLFDNYFCPGELNVMESYIIDLFKFNIDKLPDDLIDLKKNKK